VRFAVEHRFIAAIDAVEQAMTDAGFYAQLDDMAGVKAPQLVDRRERGTTIELSVRYVFAGELPSVARRVLGRGELAWVQHSTVDLVRHRIDFTVEPESHAELVRCFGAYLFRDVRPPPDAETVRTISGELQVRVPLLAARAERAIASGLVERLDAEAGALQRWLEARSSGR
jgi:hypothetical protein